MKLTKLGLFGVALGALVAAQPVAAQEQAREYHLEEQSLGDALRAVGRASGQEIMFSSDAVKGRRSRPLDGTYTTKEAVERLLARSGLVAVYRDGSILIRGRSDTAKGAVSDNGASSADIVVTGSRIRGAPSTSPVTIILREEAERYGQTDLGQLIRDLPQNFSGG
jgi:type II secretory pathway component GspD/PulD (secretin)